MKNIRFTSKKGAFVSNQNKLLCATGAARVRVYVYKILNYYFAKRPYQFFTVLNVFQIVKFPNGPCNASTSNTYGVCYTVSECTERGGYQSGTCASGFGACCICK